MATTTQTSANAQRLIKGDRLMFSSSDDNAMSKQIQATHAPDDREVDVRPLLHLIEDIFKRATPTTEAIVVPSIQAHAEALESKTNQASSINVPEALAYLIDQLACELSCKCSGSGGGDAHTITISILNMLKNYSWDAKLVLVLSACAVNFGEFWLLAHNCNTNQLAKSVAILRKIPELLERTSMLKPRFDTINNLVKVMVDITKCIVEFRELPPQYITTEVTAFSTAMTHIPVAVYWTIRGVVACASQIAGLTGLEHIVSTTESWELSSLAHKVGNMQSHLATQLSTCYRHIDERKQMEAYQNLHRLMEMIHIDNLKVLKALIYQKDDLLPLFDGVTKRRVSIDVLRRKYVLLLISDVDISQEEVAILEQINNEARQHEVVWLPILDSNAPWTENRQKHFDSLQASMPWYCVQHPSLIEPAVVKYIKEVWNFRKKAILVVIDPQGRVSSLNALHMMWIWGGTAFPFTSAREEALWKEETWKLDLLVDSIDPWINKWISEEKYICLYGGEDMEWIRKFTNAASVVAQATGISLELVYVGKSNPKERVRRNTVAISTEKLSYCWQDIALVWFFWVRIESMWQSKMQLGRTVETDPIMKEIMSILSFDASEGGWALLSRGSAEMTKEKGSTFLTCFSEYEQWKGQVQQKGLVAAINDHLKKLHSPHHCSRLVLPGTAGKIPDRVVCAECGRSMEKFVMYQCCDE